jgi:CDP-diacylglycerol--glycerol-3-phosphate 3-phosphatidyltransferase
MKPEINLPNIITLSRILLTPLFIVLLVQNDGVLVQISAGVFLIAAVSDWYDGWYARRYNAMSAFGRFFDPLADKILIGSAFFAFAFMGFLPFWMVLIIVGRDLLVTLLRVVADRRHQPVVTSRVAKWKTALQLIFLWYVVAVVTMNNVVWLRELLGPEILRRLIAPPVITTSMLLLTVLSLLTAIQYVIENRHILRLRVHGNIARSTS